jgi:hypothetical protein
VNAEKAPDLGNQGAGGGAPGDEHRDTLAGLSALLAI